jgi:hypothetical protein
VVLQAASSTPISIQLRIVRCPFWAKNDECRGVRHVYRAYGWLACHTV